MVMLMNRIVNDIDAALILSRTTQTFDKIHAVIEIVTRFNNGVNKERR